MKKTILASLFISIVFGCYFFGSSFIENRHLSKEWKKGGYLFRDRIRTSPGVLIVDHYLDDYYSEILLNGGEIKKRVPGSFITILKNGSFLTTLSDELFFWNYDGQLIWKKSIHLHHDVFLNSKEDAFFFASGENIKRPNESMVTRKDAIVGLNIKGEQIFYWSIKDHLQKIEKILGRKVERKNATYRFVYTHFNSVQEIPANALSENFPAFRAGNILVNDNRNRILFIIDRDSKEIVWNSDPKMGIYAHSVRIQPDGNLVFLLNQQVAGDINNYSSVAFLDPIKNTIIKNIVFDPPESFYTETAGSLQVLPRDRFLVTDSYKGRAFEIDGGGRIIWEWVYPDSSSSKIRPLYRVLLHSKEAFERSFL
jgi:hypothetical protein